MAEVKWIKLSTDIFNNRKIRQIECLPDGYAVIVVWVKLMCLAGNINDCGLIYFTKEIPYTDQMLATQFNMPLTTVQLALRTFEQFEMVEVIDNILHISNWEKYQNVEGMEKIREQTRKRVAKHRQNQKALPSNVTCNVTVTQGNETDIDIDIEEDKDKESNSKGKTQKRFVPPALEDVKAYCAERKNSVDAERWFNYYTANGWMVGKNKMKDWKAAVRTWEKNGYSNNQTTTTINGKTYEVKNGKYYVPGGSGIEVDPYGDDLADLFGGG